MASPQVPSPHADPGVDPNAVPGGAQVRRDPHEGGLPHLTDEEIRTWTLEQKDRWWLENVYRGDMPQLTVRSAITGMLIGGILSLTNLYVGVKTGWTLGVGITSVILAFATFRLLHQLGLAKTEFTVLENNAMQSIATAAGYMTAPLISSLAAYMMVTNRVIPMGVTLVWVVVLAILGVLFAFPLKKRFINDEQLPFPEGRAAGVVMDALHHGDAETGVFKAKLLAGLAGLAALLKVMQSHAIMGLARLPAIPEYLDGWIYKLGTPSILGTPLKDMTVRLDTDYVMAAAGGLMGIRVGVSLLVGALVNYLVLVPWMIARGDIVGHEVAGAVAYSFKDITMWSLWAGVALMTTSSLFAFFAKPQVLVSAVTRLLPGRKEARGEDVLGHIELPIWASGIGIPLVGGVVVFLAARFFDVHWWMGLIAVPLVFFFSLIAVNATGLTSITPSGALGKITQLTYGAIAPGNITTNLMTAGITGEVAGHTANLLQDIKPGYLLGGKPRHQAIGHVLGIIAGSLVAVPVFYLAFLRGDPSGMVSEAYPYPSATVWKAVAEVLTQGLSNLRPSAQLAALVGGILGIVMEGLKMATKGRFWLSAVGVGLAFILPFNTSLAMFLGAFAFWLAGRTSRPGGKVHKVMVENHEPTAAGIIAGGAIAGIAVILIEIFVIG